MRSVFVLAGVGFIHRCPKSTIRDLRKEKEMVVIKALE